MKGIFSALALGFVSFVAATYPTVTTTYTVITTVTTCPVTSTKTEHGTTKIVTDLTTSTMTITKCLNCDGVTTTREPDGHDTTTTAVIVTYTTICPVTEVSENSIDASARGPVKSIDQKPVFANSVTSRLSLNMERHTHILTPQLLLLQPRFQHTFMRLCTVQQRPQRCMRVLLRQSLPCAQSQKQKLCQEVSLH